MNVELVVNPGAGSGSVGGPELAELVRAAGHEATHRSTGDDGWEQAVRSGGADLVAVAGGDGTVRDVFLALADTGATVGVVATGTANNIAHSLGLPVDDPAASIAVWSSGASRPFDLPVVGRGGTRTRFVESVGGGVFADLLDVAEDREERVGEDGDTRDGLRMLRGVLTGATEQRWEIAVDGQDRSGAYLAVEVMNIPRVGPNVELAPGADPGDRGLDLVLVGAADRDMLLEYVDHLIETGPPGGSVVAPRLTTHVGRHIRILGPEGLMLHLDDERVDREPGEPPDRRIELAVDGDQLTVLVPGESRS